MSVSHTTARALCFTFVCLCASTVPANAGVNPTATPPMIKAAEVAYRDYVGKLQAEYTEQSKTSQFLGNINNYEMRITRSGSHFIVIFSPNKLPGHIVFGGGARYVVDNTAGIISFLPLK